MKNGVYQWDLKGLSKIYSVESDKERSCEISYTIRYIALYSIHYTVLIGWQAYRGDQIHRKNSPT